MRLPALTENSPVHAPYTNQTKPKPVWSARIHHRGRTAVSSFDEVLKLDMWFTATILKYLILKNSLIFFYEDFYKYFEIKGMLNAKTWKSL